VANEYAINQFKLNKIKFNQIIPLIQDSLNHFKETNISSLKQVFSMQEKINQYLKNR
jgi:1-deoxy-D-xylulose 5-phosphate reductoisomerase